MNEISHQPLHGKNRGEGWKGGTGNSDKGEISEACRAVAMAPTRGRGRPRGTSPQPDARKEGITKLRAEGYTLQEIGDIIGISRQRVDQILQPAKLKARTHFKYAVKVGKIPRPEICSRCGDPNPQGHHHDYSKDLDVEWLCPRCHANRSPGGFRPLHTRPEKKLKPAPIATRPRAGRRNRSTNHFLTFDGKTQCLATWAEKSGLLYTTLSNRLRRGWSVERAITMPTNP